MKTSLALIGFMGVGKSAVGRVLSEKLGKKLVRVDFLIESRAGKSISQIFQEDGEITFRELEIEIIKEIASEKNRVIDCGGGIVLNSINIDRLKPNAIIVWLKASSQVIAQRTALDRQERPLLLEKRADSDIKKLIRFRKPLYQAAADINIDTSRSDILSVSEQIMRKLKKNADFS